MSRNVVLRYGIVLLALLLIANLTKLLTWDNTDELGHPVNSEANTLSSNVVPAWLTASLDSNTGDLDIFSSFSTTQEPSDALLVTDPMPTQPILPTADLVDRVPIDAETVSSSVVQVLAISISSNPPTALVSYNGKLHIVFPGKAIEDQYLVKSISDSTVWIESFDKLTSASPAMR